MFRSSRILPSTFYYSVNSNEQCVEMVFMRTFLVTQKSKLWGFMWTFPNSNNTNTIKQKSASKDSTLETETVDRFSPLLFQRLLLPPLGLSWWPCLKLDAQTKGRALPLQPPQPVARLPSPRRSRAAAHRPPANRPRPFKGRAETKCSLSHMGCVSGRSYFWIRYDDLFSPIFFSVWAVEEENKFLIGPKQDVFFSVFQLKKKS